MFAEVFASPAGAHPVDADAERKHSADICGTPMSQAPTTAPSTPFHVFDLEAPRTSLLAFNLNESQASDNSGAEDGSNAGATVSTQTGEISSDKEDSAEEGVQPEIPILQSELGQWAEATVRAEELLLVSCPVLKSEIGKWAEGVVKAQEWLEAALDKKRVEEEKREQEFLVSCPELEAVTGSLAYRHSKHVDCRDEQVLGPAWGTTISAVDQGDGWVKIRDRYLPMVLEGLNVLTPLNSKAMDAASATGKVDPAWDGPAITVDGCVVDLDGAAPLHFSHDRESAMSHTVKMVAKAAARRCRANHVEDAKRSVIAEEVCSIDETGTMRGELFAQDMRELDTAERFKLFHDKSRRRRQQGAKVTANLQQSVLCPGPDGKVFVFLYVDTAKRNRKARLLATQAIDPSPENKPQMPWRVDIAGNIYDSLDP